MPSYGTVDHDYGMRLATCDPAADGAIYMLNLMKYRHEADYGADGHGGVSGREADDRYAPFDVLAAIGAAVCFTADVLEASEDWDRVGVVRYPTRRAFIEMQSRQDFQEKHVHKEAGMDHTIVMTTLPVAALPGKTKPRRILLEVWDGDAPPSVGGDSAPTSDVATSDVATSDVATFDVEGTIVGDGRAWSGARYTTLDNDTDVRLAGATAAHQLLLLQPVIDRWT